MKALFILTLAILLVGCSNSYELVQQTDDTILYFDSEEVYVPRNVIRITENGTYYNIYYNQCYIIEYDGDEYQTYEEITELISVVGPEEIYELGYRMEKKLIDGILWEKNYD